MKHTVFVTVTMSVEIDDTELKKEFGSVSKKLIYQEAINKAKLKDAIHAKAEIFESYEDEPKKKVRKGIGSY